MPALTPRLDHRRYVDAIGEQTAAMRDLLATPGADLRLPVPSCPGWNLAQLTRHVAEELPWLEGMVRTRASSMADDSAMRDLDPDPAHDAVTVGEAIAAGGTALAEWMELGALPEMLTFHPHRRELLGPGRTLLVAPKMPPSTMKARMRV